MSLWSRAVSALGLRAAPSGDMLSDVSAIGPEPFGAQPQRIGGDLNPRTLSTIIREADDGHVSRLCDLGNESRQKDCHLQSVCHTRETALCGLDWDVRPKVRPGWQKPVARDAAAADWVKEALLQATGLESDPTARGFHDLIAHLTGGAFFGHAVAESFLDLQKGRIVPVAWKTHGARRFAYDTSNDGRLYQYDAIGNYPFPGVDFQAVWPGKFIVHQPRITGDSPHREGLIRVLVWAALFRNWDLRDWIQLAELSWKPWRFGRYSGNAKPSAVEQLSRILQRMSVSGVALFNKDIADVTVEWPKAQGQSSHQALADWLGAEISKAVLGQTLTTEAGARGARSLGEIHDQIRRDIREADARAVAATIRRHIIAPLIRWNFGPDVAIPDFVFITEDGVNLNEFSEGIERLTNAGLRIPASWVRDQAGIPDPDEGDETLGPAVDVDVSEFDNGPDASSQEPQEEASPKAEAQS
ncbi:MAG: phage portal protein family protein [Solirubrobacterales bacterium]